MAQGSPSQGPRKAPGGPLRAFHSRDFSLFWLASLISMVAFFMLIIARGWLVLELTNSPFMLTAVAGVSQLPSLLLSIPGGVLADRFDRKTIMLTGEAVNALALLALAYLVASGTVQVWQVFLLSLVNGVTFALVFPSRASVVPNLVPREDIANGVALSSTMFSGAQLIGPALAGWLLAAYGMGTTFSLAVGGPLLAFLLFIPVRVKRTAWAGPRRAASPLADVREGISYILRNQVVLGLMAIALVVVVFGMPYQTVLPVFARDILNAGEIGLGILGAAGGLGAIVGSLVVASFYGPASMRNYVVGGTLGLGIVVILFALSPLFPLSVALALLAGFTFQLLFTANFALIQVQVPDHLRGRVLSVRFIIFGLSPLGIFALGTAAETIGTPLATAGTGLACLVAGALVLLAFPGLRQAIRAEA